MGLDLYLCTCSLDTTTSSLRHAIMLLRQDVFAVPDYSNTAHDSQIVRRVPTVETIRADGTLS